MNELELLKEQADIVMLGASQDFILIDHDFMEDDIWVITVESAATGNVYTFKSEGAEFYDFKEKA